ncbi:hypothetical protein [Lederbergia citrea]|uniref:hypothetical protein n=1 Tax=Lederbergia citrea TaxID=2833581 RepID=UPI001BCA5537|nr:hypothetical protein [Lederbergia citrea]MBS4176858.1 hypothetical protein [Lederbergia citrea]
MNKILKNDFDDDEIINHLAIFSSDQKGEILMMNDVLGSSGTNIGIYGYAIYGVHLYSIMTHCKERLEGTKLILEDYKLYLQTNGPYVIVSVLEILIPPLRRVDFEAR